MIYSEIIKYLKLPANCKLAFVAKKFFSEYLIKLLKP